MRKLKANKHGQVGDMTSAAGHTHIPPQSKEFEVPKSAEIIDDNISNMKSRDLDSLAKQLGMLFEKGTKIDERRNIVRGLIKEKEDNEV